METQPINVPDREEIKAIVANFIKALGLNLSDPNLEESPRRIADAYLNELFEGLYRPAPEIKTFPNEHHYNQMVTVGPIEITSMCSHHFLPFIGYAFVSYIPNNTVVGLSKFSRIVKWYAHRPQLQEALTDQIAEHIWRVCDPKGCGVKIVAQHMCMTLRGVKEENAMMRTTSLKGLYLDKPSAKEEFLAECSINNE